MYFAIYTHTPIQLCRKLNAANVDRRSKPKKRQKESLSHACCTYPTISTVACRIRVICLRVGQPMAHVASVGLKVQDGVLRWLLCWVNQPAVQPHLVGRCKVDVLYMGKAKDRPH